VHHTGKMAMFGAIFKVNSKLWDFLGHFHKKDTVDFNEVPFFTKQFL